VCHVLRTTRRHKLYVNATTGYLIELLPCLLLRKCLRQYQARSQTPTLFDIISLRVDAVLRHDQDTRKEVHTCARSKMTQYNIVNNV